MALIKLKMPPILALRKCDTILSPQHFAERCFATVCYETFTVAHGPGICLLPRWNAHVLGSNARPKCTCILAHALYVWFWARAEWDHVI